MKYRPSPIPNTFQAETRNWLNAELRRIATALEGVDNLRLNTQGAEPSKYEDGDVVYADGTSWDPGSGEGMYVRENGAWVKAGGASGATELSGLSDVNTSTPTNRNALIADGIDWESRPIVEADVSDLGSYLTTVVAGDVNAEASTDGWVLTSDGAGNAAWEAVAASAEVNDLSAAVTWANIPIANVPTGTTGSTVALGNHTHVAANVTDFDTEVANNTAVAANTAKVSNATHTGDVTGSTVLTIAAGAVDIAMLANGTDGQLITWSATGAPTTVATGTATHVLTSNGAGAAPTFQAAAGGGGVGAKPGMIVGSGALSLSSSTAWKTMDLTTQTYDPDSNYSVASDIVTVAGAGYYLITYTFTYHPTGGATNDSIKCRMTKNGTSTVLTGSTTQSLIYKANTRPSQVVCTFMALLAANDTIRLQQACETGTSGTQLGTSTNVSIIKVRDT